MRNQAQLKGLRLSRFLALFILFFLSCAPNLQAQDEDPYENQEIVKEGQGNYQGNYEEEVNAAMEEATKDPQAALKELQKHIDPQQMADLQKAIKEGDQAKIQEITKAINLKMTTSGAGLDKMVDVSLRTFRDQTPEALKAQLLERMQGTLFMPIIETFPRLMDFGVNMLQDPVALPALFRIAKDRKKLLIFLGINILIFIFSKIVKRQKNKPNAFTRWLFFASMRFAVLIFFFHKELWPSFVVFKRTFL